MADKKLLDIRFVKIEKLSGRAKAKAVEKGWTEGLALLKTSLGSTLPVYEIDKIYGDPLEALLKIGKEEGITEAELNRALDEASSETA